MAASEHSAATANRPVAAFSGGALIGLLGGLIGLGGAEFRLPLLISLCVMWMAAASIIGALVGGVMHGLVATVILYPLLSAIKVWRHE